MDLEVDMNLDYVRPTVLKFLQSCKLPAKAPLETSGKDGKTTLEMSGEDWVEFDAGVCRKVTEHLYGVGR